MSTLAVQNMQLDPWDDSVYIAGSSANFVDQAIYYKLRPNGSLVWSGTVLGSGGRGVARDITYAPNDHTLAMVGGSSSSNLAGTNPNKGNTDCFISLLNARNGTSLFTYSFGN